MALFVKCSYFKKKDPIEYNSVGIYQNQAELDAFIAKLKAEGNKHVKVDEISNI